MTPAAEAAAPTRNRKGYPYAVIRKPPLDEIAVHPIAKAMKATPDMMDRHCGETSSC